MDEIKPLAFGQREHKTNPQILRMQMNDKINA
jgi:hypothetical protein